jgi:hypothetical protein
MERIKFGSIYFRGRDGSVGIATGYGLDGPGIESRWGARFLAHVQTGPGAHPASCTMGTGSFPGVKRPGVVLTTHPLLAPRSGKSRAIPLPPLWAFGPVTEYLYLFTSIYSRHCFPSFFVFSCPAPQLNESFACYVIHCY